MDAEKSVWLPFVKGLPGRFDLQESTPSTFERTSHSHLDRRWSYTDFQERFLAVVATVCWRRPAFGKVA